MRNNNSKNKITMRLQGMYPAIIIYTLVQKVLSHLLVVRTTCHTLRASIVPSANKAKVVKLRSFTARLRETLRIDENEINYQLPKQGPEMYED